MLIDWFTVIVQIINFLVLVALLKRFLYSPIIKAMEQREQKIANLLEAAAAEQQEAQAQAKLYQQKQQELENQKQTWLAEAKQEIAIERQTLKQAAEHEINSLRHQWYESLQWEKQAFLNTLRQRVSQQILMTVRRVLGDLANTSLEQQIVNTFVQRLEEFNWPSQTNPQVVIKSNFTLNEETRSQLIATLERKITHSITVKFEEDTSLICGIELLNHGYKISWNVDHYLDGLEGQIQQALTNHTGQSNVNSPR